MTMDPRGESLQERASKLTSPAAIVEALDLRKIIDGQG